MILVNLSQNKIDNEPTVKEFIKSILNQENFLILDNVKKRINKKVIYNSNKQYYGKKKT